MLLLGICTMAFFPMKAGDLLWYLVVDDAKRVEINELIENCDWQWTVKGESVTGYEITSKKNGKSIFQPTPGVYIGENLILPGKSGVYWSSKIHEDLGFAYNLNIGKYRYEWYWGIFERGFSVRPVQKNK